MTDEYTTDGLCDECAYAAPDADHSLCSECQENDEKEFNERNKR